MRKMTMPQGFPMHIQRKETQGNIISFSGGLGVASSNLAAPTIPVIAVYFDSDAASAKSPT
jgi:hypothetical protein